MEEDVLVFIMYKQEKIGIFFLCNMEEYGIFDISILNGEVCVLSVGM